MHLRLTVTTLETQRLQYLHQLPTMTNLKPIRTNEKGFARRGSNRGRTSVRVITSLIIFTYLDLYNCSMPLCGDVNVPIL